ncbi:MAG: hypothetical protein AXW12_00455 [Thalassospira sp. Nap_22]|nr:MAG: hypothetical protein AXW12_00455 [Thalassospira sp. Nap_22]
MSALQDEIKQAMAEMTAPLYERITSLEHLIKETVCKENPLIPLNEAAKMLGMHPATLRRKCRDGDFKFKRVGNKIFLYRSELITS